MEVRGTLTSLEQLILNGCANLTDAGLAPLQGLTGLTGLALERTNVTDAGLANLRGLTELRYLSLNWTRTSDSSSSFATSANVRPSLCWRNNRSR
jgi:hypothetical protein